MSHRRPRVCQRPQTDEVYPVESDPGRFFGEPDRSRRDRRKALQLCKQVERAVAVTLAGECASEALLGAAVAGVEPAPDSGRMRVAVVLAPGRATDDVDEAAAELRRSAAAFRAEAARSIHRKRAPELVFVVRLSEEASDE